VKVDVDATTIFPPFLTPSAPPGSPLTNPTLFFRPKPPVDDRIVKLGCSTHGSALHHAIARSRHFRRQCCTAASQRSHSLLRCSLPALEPQGEPSQSSLCKLGFRWGRAHRAGMTNPHHRSSSNRMARDAAYRFGHPCRLTSGPRSGGLNRPSPAPPHPIWARLAQHGEAWVRLDLARDVFF
jgi:hypothetical protein